MTTSSRTERQGLIYGLLSYVIWGTAPIYFKFLEQIPTTEVLSHRVIWSVALIALAILISQRWSVLFAILRQPKEMAWLITSSFFIGGNWYIYIEAINANHVLEASLGYYISPLTLILFAVIFLHERLSLLKTVAVGLATIGVLVQIFFAGIFPWVALLLAVTFSCFSLIRKVIKVDSLTALLIETMILSPFAIYFLFGIESHTGSLQANDWELNLLLISSGLITTLPLLFYAEAANRMSLSTLGFMQYIAPTIMWLLAVFLFHEPLDPATIISFGFIWVGLICYSLENVFRSK
ncbi:MAG: EamA family transporter RarD [Gammaproteobacteria bacterium]